jgi:hypothetical protein
MQKQQGAQQPMNDKENMVCIHHGILLSHKEKLSHFQENG